jgi:hypothetical protein
VFFDIADDGAAIPFGDLLRGFWAAILFHRRLLPRDAFCRWLRYSLSF